MPEFQYVAREMSGGEVSGVLTAGNEQEVISSLGTQQLFPLKIDLAETAKTQQRFVGKRVRPKFLSIFYSQLSDLLRSGVPLLRSLDLLLKQKSTPALNAVLERVRDDVADGTPLATAMGRHPTAFSELSVSMIRAGEEGSFMEDVLKRIANFTDQQEDLKSRVMGAIAYPAVVLALGVGLVSVIMVFFVPKFEPMFDRLRAAGELPLPTTILLGTSSLLVDYWMLFVAAVIGLIFAGYSYLNTDDGRMLFDRFRIGMIGMGPIVRSLAIARFCRILGTLLHNGVPILQSLRIGKDATGNLVLAAAIADAADNISSGKSLAKPLAASKQFPDQVVEMISVGEEANNLEQVLVDVAETMEKQTYRQLDLFVRLLEPVMIVIMAGVVLFIALALLLPVFKMSGVI